MTHPSDNSEILKTADEIREYEHDRGERSRDAEVSQLKAELADLQGEFDAYKAAHPEKPVEPVEPEPPTPEPEPEPKPPVSSKPLCLVGMSTPATDWAAQKKLVEAGGGKLQARRVFLQGFGSSLTLVSAAHAEGLLPVVSFKIGDWGDAASGKQDSAARSLASNLAKMSRKVAVCIHHEPDQQSTPPDQGEGGTGAEFAAMYRRLTPILKTATNVEVWPIMNGWWWTDRSAKFTDAQINVWLPADVRRMIDGIAADDYSPQGGEPGVVKTRNRVAWAKRVGDVKALGIGETNAYTAKELEDSFALAASEPLFRGGWSLVWNSTGGAYLPLTATGLMDDFQKIVKEWPR